SIHFRPSRSLPVSTAGAFRDAAFGSRASPAGGLSCAAAGNARQIASEETGQIASKERRDGLCKDLMDGLIELLSLDTVRTRRRLMKLYRDMAFHPEPGAHGTVSLSV